MPDSFLHGVEVVEIDHGPRPIRTVRSSVIGVVGTAPEADAEAFPLDTPILVAGSRREAAKLGEAGTLPDALASIFDQVGAMVVVIRVAEGSDDSDTRANVIGGVDAETDAYTGVHALKAAQSRLGLTPRLLVAPGFTHQRPPDPDDPDRLLANPVVAALQAIAKQLRATIIADGPDTTDEAAIACRGDWGSARVFLVDPHVRVDRGGIRTVPVSAAVAGLIARIDAERGFWWSPSNQELFGIIGTARPVDFRLGDRNARANYLNENDVATVIRENGYRLWGNRTCSSDPRWAFLSVRRTADMVNESVQRAHLWAVDRAISRTYIEDVTEGVNGYLRSLKARGAILGGECWPDPDLNTPANISQGKVYFNFDFTAPYPAEHITFRSMMTDGYLEELIA
ncbi:phage tail sheath subtilisin-like domain-containing protein [Fodinicurvata sp. EGI_FJ10296]|uniref:phage tail sheath subtilisin-like domain-containing protein n=1 Tax=Fodinicurvata sp. EGI_FJ10296 TaxID=3231908 RepID=UPI00345516E5